MTTLTLKGEVRGAAAKRSKNDVLKKRVNLTERKGKNDSI